MPHLGKTISHRLANMLAASLSRLTAHEIESIARLTAGEISARKVEALSCFGTALASGNGAFDAREHAGESGLIERTARFPFELAFDVGANVGDWSRQFCKVHSKAEVHCFEIVPETFARLRDLLDGDAVHAVLNAFGLSDAEELVEVFVARDDRVSSIYDARGLGPKRKQMCRVRRGSDYARERGIQRIDFLKIDVEGAEGRVLRGLADYFDRRQVRLAQFEFNEFAIESHFLLIDFYRFLTERGYLVGRLTPDGVIFSDYRYELESYHGNYVSCRQNDDALIIAVQAPP